ncbi:hypothetical protein [Hydrogenovibrio halophilus]|uniref:hypothetical protein n=1 Tax=Hydrogenovibrio halophilus TaxID=373391 RepID=UPI00048B75F3|nr:hypothetical protein [Hydrogenovibrio halophilus]
MRNLLIMYSIILALGIGSMLSGVHYLANVAGFIGAIGLMLVFFKDRPDESAMTEEERTQSKKMRRYWYIVFITGIVFSLIFGSLWNSHMGRMV